MQYLICKQLRGISGVQAHPGSRGRYLKMGCILDYQFVGVIQQLMHGEFLGQYIDDL